MNGLLAICKKQDISSTALRDVYNGGLKTLSHRGNKACTSFILDEALQPTDATEAAARMILGSCSFQDKESHLAFHNGNILLFEGRLVNRNRLFEQLSITPEDSISDSEIVMQLMEKSGTNCLKSLEGFWSLIYLDFANKTIYGARDHFGNRTMNFCNTNGQFALSSESRTLYSIFEDAREINKDTVIDYLLWGSIGKSDQYFFKDIHSIEPSHYVKYELVSDKLTVDKYYHLPYNRDKTIYNANNVQEYTSKLYDLITDSVQKNLNLYDGALAIGVSGGMDSSALICTAKKMNPERTLVAYTTTDEYDGGELLWAEKIVRHTGSEWIKVVCTPKDIVEKLDDVNRAHSMPLYNPSSLAQYRIMEEVKKQGQAVCIDGQGGDEMLGGYQDYYPLMLRSLRKNGDWKNWRNELSQTANAGISKKEIFMRCLKEWAKAHYYTPQVLAQKKRKHQFESLMSQPRDSYFKNPSPIPYVDKEILNDALFESYTVFLANILRWGEHSAAAHGIECVMPLSDSIELAEFAFSVPSTFKIHDGWNKYLLRKSMVGTIPDEICWRKQKFGFYIPEPKWLSEIDKDMFDVIEKMDDPEGCINKKYILENRNLCAPNNFLYQRFIFRCYSYLLWRNGLTKSE